MSNVKSIQVQIISNQTTKRLFYELFRMRPLHLQQNAQRQNRPLQRNETDAPQYTSSV